MEKTFFNKKKTRRKIQKSAAKDIAFKKIFSVISSILKKHK